ncbi:MAG TPA: PilN domain-containing protein [Burkholderiales bacterium]|nr:PilN domain-containing protein [Burkholderiales bacterium]
MSQQINLYNPIFLKQEKYFSTKAIGQALGLVVTGLVAFYAFALLQTRSAEALLAQTREQVAKQRERFLAIAPKFTPATRSKVLEAELGRVETEVRTRRTTLEALSTGELGNTQGFSEYLAALARQSVPGVWLTGIVIGESGKDLRIEGRALRPELVPAYLKALNEEPVMRGREVKEMKVAAKESPPAAAKAPAPAGPARYVEFGLAAGVAGGPPAKSGDR